MPKRDNPRTGPKYEKSAPAGRKTAAGRGRAAGASKVSGTASRTAAKTGGRIAAAKSGTVRSAAKRPQLQEENPNLLIGRNPITEAIKAGRPIDKLLMQKDAEGSARHIASLALEEGIPIQYVDKLVLDKLAPGKAHQGVAAYAAAHKYVGVEDILAAAKEKGEDPLVIVLDELEDPHNLGAILRSADAAGAHGVIIPSRRSVTLTETVAKASAGAIEYVPVAKAGNLSRCIDLLKSKGLWIAAVDMDGTDYRASDLNGPMALIIGGEGKGVSPNLKAKSDYVISIPMYGHVNSLNASNAAAIVLFEAAGQRR